MTSSSCSFIGHRTRAPTGLPEQRGPLASVRGAAGARRETSLSLWGQGVWHFRGLSWDLPYLEGCVWDLPPVGSGPEVPLSSRKTQMQSEALTFKCR